MYELYIYILKKQKGESTLHVILLFQFSTSANNIKTLVLSIRQRREKSSLEEEAEAAAKEKEEKQVRVALQEEMDGLIG